MPLIDLKSDLTWNSKTPPGDAGPQDRISRSVTDTRRIAKYLASTNGALFVIKQAGLQLTNPNTESIFGLPSPSPKINANKQFTPIKLLANVAGAGLGLHVSRHGILPFAELTNYESTIIRNRPDALNNNRLIRLKRELIDSQAVLSKSVFESKVTSFVQQIQKKLGYSGQVINTLTSVTGPKSLMGVGITTFRVAEKRVLPSGQQRYSITTQYAQLLTKSVYVREKGTYNNDTNKNETRTSDVDNRSLANNKSLKVDFENKIQQKQIPESLQKSQPASDEYRQKYLSVAYGNIPKDHVGDVTQIRNFIDTLPKKEREALLSKEGIGTYKTQADYDKNNIIKKFGYKHYTTNLVANQSVTDLDKAADARGYDKDIIHFKIGSTVFRAYIDSISDSVSPTIDTEQPLGAPFNAVRFRGIERSVSVSFKIAVFVKSDLKKVYSKLATLQSYAFYGTDSSQSFYALKTLPVRIGNLYNFTGYVESVSYDWDSEMPWEIEDGNQVPLYCNVSVDFKYLVPKAGFALA